MKFELKKSLEILEKTPRVIEALCSNLSEDWLLKNEGGESWSPFDVIGHLIHGEITDWIPRLLIILSDQNTEPFKSFDRFAQFERSKGKTTVDLISEFRKLRQLNLNKLVSLQLSEQQLNRKGMHPEFGEVSAKQLLSTWTVHDLVHINQITRVMARQYTNEIGPWVNYIGLLKA